MVGRHLTCMKVHQHRSIEWHSHHRIWQRYRIFDECLSWSLQTTTTNHEYHGRRSWSYFTETKTRITQNHTDGGKKTKTIQDDLDALCTPATLDGPVFPRKKIARRNAKRILKNSSKGGLWLDSRATLHSLISKMTWAKVPLVQLLKRH